MGRVLAVDYGQKKIGLALSDENQIIASPYKTLLTQRKMDKTVNILLDEVKLIEKERGCVTLILVGMPYNLKGKNSLMTDEVELFVKSLKEQTSIQVLAFDERMTTQLAEKSLKNAGMQRKKRAKVVDMISASLVLQTYLEGL